jgi:hypothetical protein
MKVGSKQLGNEVATSVSAGRPTEGIGDTNISSRGEIKMSLRLMIWDSVRGLSRAAMEGHTHSHVSGA